MEGSILELSAVNNFVRIKIIRDTNSPPWMDADVAKEIRYAQNFSSQ